MGLGKEFIFAQKGEWALNPIIYQFHCFVIIYKYKEIVPIST